MKGWATCTAYAQGSRQKGTGHANDSAGQVNPPHAFLPLCNMQTPQHTWRHQHCHDVLDRLNCLPHTLPHTSPHTLGSPHLEVGVHPRQHTLQRQHGSLDARGARCHGFRSEDGRQQAVTVHVPPPQPAAQLYCLDREVGQGCGVGGRQRYVAGSKKRPAAQLQESYQASATAAIANRAKPWCFAAVRTMS